MPYYKCILINESGDINTKVLYAKNKKNLEKNYLGKDERILSLKRSYSDLLNTSVQLSSKVKNSEFILFNQKLVILLRSGTSFIKALQVILAEMNSSAFKEILIKVESDITNGESISNAFNSPNIPFIKIYKASLLAGEKSGNLIPILEKFNSYTEKITNLKRKTYSSLSYPIVLFVFMVAMIFVVMTFVIPSFSGFYESFNANLPDITLFFIKVSNIMQENYMLFFLFMFLFYSLIKIIEKYTKYIIIHRFILSIPFIGDIILQNALAVFSRTLSILISGGIPIPESSKYAIEVFSNKYIYSKFKDIPNKIIEGNLLSHTIKEIDIVPGIMKEVVQIGDSSGNLSEILNKNADFFESAIDSKINSFISLIEPIMIIVLGSVVTFMLISIYLPIFNSMRVIQ